MGSSTGGSVNFCPRLLMMKAVVAKTIRSGRRQRTMIMRCSSAHLGRVRVRVRVRVKGEG